MSAANVCKPCDPIRKIILQENIQPTENGASPTSGESNTSSPKRALSPQRPLSLELSVSDPNDLDDGSLVDTSGSVRTGCLEIKGGEPQPNEYEQIPSRNVAEGNHLH